MFPFSNYVCSYIYRLTWKPNLYNRPSSWAYPCDNVLWKKLLTSFHSIFRLMYSDLVRVFFYRSASYLYNNCFKHRLHSNSLIKIHLRFYSNDKNHDSHLIKIVSIWLKKYFLLFHIRFLIKSNSNSILLNDKYNISL